MLDDNNVFVKTFRMAKERITEHGQPNIKIKLIGRRTGDARTYNLPTVSEVAALIVGDLDDSLGERDLIIETQSGDLKRINELNTAYLGLQYPLLFPYGEDGYREDIPLCQLKESRSSNARTAVSMREFFAYRLHERESDAKTSTLKFIRRNQKQLRCDLYKGLTEALSKGETNPASQGKRVILPSTFTGGARFIVQTYQDAMAICKWVGYPNLFITFTCNQKWPEITRYVQRGNDRVTASFFKSTKEDRENNKVDEVEMYYDCRYISPCEAAWRIFGFKIQYKKRPVERLSFHLPNEQNVIFGDTDTVQDVLKKPTVGESMFLSWFDANREYPEARNLTYAEFPTKYVWKQNEMNWKPRKKGSSIGRIFYVPTD